MSGHASVAAAIAALALSLGALAPTNTAHAAATCNAAPKPTAPQGQHWYYRTDRSLGRKCWYLAAEGRNGRAAPQTAAAQPDEDANVEPAAPPMAEAAARLTEPLRSAPPPRPAPAAAFVAQAMPTLPNAATMSPAPDQPVAEPAGVAQAPAATAPPAANVAEPVADARPSADATPAAAPVAAAPAAIAPALAPERSNPMQFVFVAFVGLCLLAGLFFYLAMVRRRRMEVRIVDLNTPAPLRRGDIAAMSDAPSVAPDERERDSAQIDEERLRRFSRAWKERAA